MEQALVEVKEAQAEGKGTGTGIIARYLPALNQYASQIRSIRGQLGLGVVGSVTFGALSKGELDLAMSINFNSDLTGDELIKDLENRIRLKKMLLEETTATYQRLTNAPSLEAFRKGEIDVMKRRTEVRDSYSKYKDALIRIDPYRWTGITELNWKDFSPNERDEVLRVLEEQQAG